MTFDKLKELFAAADEARQAVERKYPISDRYEASVYAPHWLDRRPFDVSLTAQVRGTGCIEHHLTAHEHRKMAIVADLVDAWRKGGVSELPESGWEPREP